MAALLLIASWLSCAAAATFSDLARRDTGDVFTLLGGECGAAVCAEHGAGAARRPVDATQCACACPQRAPLFREDRELCVDDLPECSLATFGTGIGVQRIPFVYLPLKGQIIHPSREITFQNVKTPICAVSGAQFLTRKGFLDLRNTIDADVPFSLFRDEGRTFLQWSGEDELRTRMAGRVMVVRLLCRDVSAVPSSPLDLRGVFTPCVAFRVQGTPPRSVNNITEVQFATNVQTAGTSPTSGLTITEYVVIGISSLLLGLIYVASVFFYLHIRKRRKAAADKNSVQKIKVLKSKDGKIITERDIVRINNERMQTIPNVLGQDDGVIKKNPLLNRQYHDNKGSFPSDSGSNMSDSDEFAGSSSLSEDNVSKKQTTSAVVHLHNHELRHQNDSDVMYRDESSIEKLPDEHVSIVETIDDREIHRPVGTTRRKLYFNPAYFEPHLMAEPPPAALEFLTKIREVISIAKHKMAAKRFHPVLNEIPEEESYPSNGNSLDLYHGLGSQRSGSFLSLKRENSRKKSVSCVGCPGCKTDVDLKNHLKNDTIKCSNCLNIKGDKQNSIRKWLENIPNLKQEIMYNDVLPDNSHKHISGSLPSLSVTENICHIKKQNSFSDSNSIYSCNNLRNVPKRSSTRSVRSEPSLRNCNLPSGEIENFDCHHNFHHCQNVSTICDDVAFNECRAGSSRSYKTLKQINKIKNNNNSLPDMVNEAIALEHCSKSDNVSSSDEDKNANRSFKIEGRSTYGRNKSESPNGNDYETDSLERTTNKKRVLTTDDYPDIPSSQASPSLSSALPLEEELTMRNAVYKTHSSSSSKTPSPKRDICIDQNYYETLDRRHQEILLNPILRSNSTRAKNDYSLVSEVYVNNNYNFGSAPSSPSGSECSMGSRKRIEMNSECQERTGCLTIEVKDPPENYIKIHESDGFEPDTLDRKYPKHKEYTDNIQFIRKKNIRTIDNDVSKPNQLIELRSSGTFVKTSSTDGNEPNFKSLRNISTQNRETKVSSSINSEIKVIEDSEDTLDDSGWYMEEGRILTLEYRHSKRQRQCTPPAIKQLHSLPRPDILPPLPPTRDVSLYEKPSLPHRRVENDVTSIEAETHLKSLKNNIIFPNQSNSLTEVDPCLVTNDDIRDGRTGGPLTDTVPSQSLDCTNSVSTVFNLLPKPSISYRNSKRRISKNCCNTDIDTNTFVRGKEEGHSRTKYKRRKGTSIEDSGYLSSDSTGSRQVIQRKLVLAKILNCSDTDDTENEARSESGAESTETHSVYFGSFRKLSSGDENSNNNNKSF